MSYVRGFLPWIVFSVVSHFGWQWAALAALAIGVSMLVRDRRAGVTADAQILDFGTIVFFGLLSAVAFAQPHSPLQTYASAVSSAWLALIAVVSMLAGRPFVLGVAKRSTPPEIWHTARFRHTSKVLTIVWTISFALGAVLMFTCKAVNAGGLPDAVVQVLGFAVPAVVTYCYVKAVRARAAAVATPGALSAVRES
jgi:hypothetical protein